jgi:hypothetical protein
MPYNPSRLFPQADTWPQHRSALRFIPDPREMSISSRSWQLQGSAAQYIPRSLYMQIPRRYQYCRFHASRADNFHPGLRINLLASRVPLSLRFQLLRLSILPVVELVLIQICGF